MIQWTEEAENLAWATVGTLLASCYPVAIKAAYAFRDERQQAAIAHQEWEAKLLADNLADSGEDRFRREKYGIKGDE